MTVLLPERRSYPVHPATLSRWASMLGNILLPAYVLAVLIAIAHGTNELLVLLSFGVGPVIGVVCTAWQIGQTIRRRRWRAWTAAAMHRIWTATQHRGLPALYRVVFKETRGLLSRVECPILRGGIRLLRHAAVLSTQESIGPSVLRNEQAQTKLETAVRDLKSAADSADFLAMYQAIGELMVIFYYAPAQADNTRGTAPPAHSDSEVAEFLRQAATSIRNRDPGPPLRRLRRLFQDIAQVFPLEKAAIPMLALSWVYLRIVTLMESPAMRSAPPWRAWADPYEKTALLTYQMADALKQGRLCTVVQLIGESYDPSRRILKSTAGRPFEGLPADLHHRH